MATNPDHAVNESERMRHYSLRVTARKQCNWRGFDRIQAASLERRVYEAGETDVMDKALP
jgi:hypothetical protein